MLLYLRELLEKIKINLYNTKCFSPIESQCYLCLEERHMPNAIQSLFCNTAEIYLNMHLVKLSPKCSIYINESQARGALLSHSIYYLTIPNSNLIQVSSFHI